ncbi:P63C domain-containing protein [Anatilimnocola floriformis]|uniref:P63C domain-containing protein n=1 Tax=Anatilimnocola floriformis TaxID=2948575 RepID=UPI0020C560CF|nr:P63C domain-containing protein [Anatilimnocola floriformis]
MGKKKKSELASEHARALSELGAAKGGKARAESMEPDERKAVAKAAAAKRWGGVAVKATHDGALTIAGNQISCAVLEDGRRVLTQETFLEAIGRSPKGKGGQAVSSPDGLPPFLSAEALKPFVDDDLRKATVPIVFRSKNGARTYGYEAKLLPRVCEVYLKARDAGKTTKQQQRIVDACDILVRGLAEVGITALVDEATGFQYDRARHALEEILEAFIKDELGKWAKRFPDEFYVQLFRLKGLNWPTEKNPPQYVGHWTNNLVYKRLAPGVLDELRSKTPKSARGHRTSKFHQWLTDDVGHPKLQEHISAVIALMKSSDDWTDFERRLNKALPKYLPIRPMPLFDHLDDPELLPDEPAS